MQFITKSSLLRIIERNKKLFVIFGEYTI